ncbi:MAG: UbiD family decarboxylase [Veillonellaceae bacterium]|nr:UbiD family decarboxylase [Veillonellaceae bacterium]
MRKITDLRSFLAVLQEYNQLDTIHKEVNWQYELGSVLATLEKQNRGAGLFRNVTNKSFAVCGGVLGSMDRIALALECSKQDINDCLAKCLEQPIPPRIVAEAPCQENILQGENVDLGKLPIPQHAPKDGGPFITGGVVVSKGLHSTRQNLSFQRMQVKGRDTLSIMINEWRHLKEFFDEAEAENRALPIAVVCGADPVIYIAAGLRYDGDETAIAGAMRGEGIEVVQCITSDIYVPANAEFVIEGEIQPHYREDEGPLGEFTGHYSRPWNSPVLKVKAITHRTDAIYQTINGASFEHINLGNVLPREPLLKKFAKYVSSGVINVHIPPYGSGFMAVIQLKKKNPGEPKNVAMAAMITYVNIKNVIVVDEDVDIFNPADIFWAVSNRVVPERDIFYVPNAQGHELDPCSDQRGVQTKMGIDATLSEDSKGLERVRYPQVDLKEYLE